MFTIVCLPTPEVMCFHTIWFESLHSVIYPLEDKTVSLWKPSYEWQWILFSAVKKRRVVCLLIYFDIEDNSSLKLLPLNIHFYDFSSTRTANRVTTWQMCLSCHFPALYTTWDNALNDNILTTRPHPTHPWSNWRHD